MTMTQIVGLIAFTAVFLVLIVVVIVDAFEGGRREAIREADERKRTAEALRQAAREIRARRVETNTIADAIRSRRKP
jgi:hypothetical protein